MQRKARPNSTIIKKKKKKEIVILIGPPHALDPFPGRKVEGRRDQDRRLNRNHM